MSNPDVMALLDHWIAALKGHPAAWAGISYEEVQRVRDEIVQLRKVLHAEMMGRPDRWHAFIDETRNDALEEAARVCESGYTTGSTASTLKAVAAAIRALKDRGDDRTD